MGLKFSNNGALTLDDLAFYEARAAAGVGLIITGGTIVHESSVLRGRRQQEAYRAENVAGFASLAETVHRYDTKIFGQLFHRGREPIADSDGPLLAPSVVASPTSHQFPHALTVPEIRELTRSFAQSARHLMEAGFDGVELHGAHGYLIGQFLSPHANHRTDSYGGSLPNRARFAVEVGDAVREAIGTIPLGLRISADEELEDGLREPESSELAAFLSASGLFEYLSVAVGVRGSYVKDMSHANGIAVPLAAAVRKASGLPVIASQRITHPTLAEEVLATGAADVIGMARAHIADSQWTRWAREGALDRILPCVGCLQDCRSGNGGIGCVHSPVSGRERRWGSLARSSERRRVVVVGAGPAGLEAARIAAERGHRVVVLEQAEAPGGQVAMAALAPGRAEIDGVVSFRIGELDRLGVTLRLGTEATIDVVLAEEPDAVIVATGSRPGPAAFPIGPGSTVWDLWQLFRAPDHFAQGDVVVVVDDGSGSWETYSAAELLAERGVAVTLVTPASAIANGIPTESVGPLLRRLSARNVTLLPMTAVSEVTPGEVLTYEPARLAARHVLEERKLTATAVVHVGPKVPDDALALMLAPHVTELRVIGDALTPRRISQAVLEGHDAGRRC
jgi:2,4-dienoyl-CoA reductase (NADPH2)